MLIDFNTSELTHYHRFLTCKALPRTQWKGTSLIVPDDVAHYITGTSDVSVQSQYIPPDWMFDYQRDICRMAIKKRRFAVFADCGLGKTPILLEFARHAREQGKRALIISPPMVVEQTIQEAGRFFGDLPIERVRSSGLQKWLDDSGTDTIGITNYEALKHDLNPGDLGCLVLDESSMLKSHYGKYARGCINLGSACEYRLCCTGTPAPNDRIEYANHAVFLGASRTVNAFLARYFINRGQTQNRWELKPHALRPFYRDLSHWSIFISDPSVYGWHDNCETIPPIHVHVEDVEMTRQQIDKVQRLTGGLFATSSGGIGQRSKLGQIAKSGDSRKPAYIRDRISSWPDESTIIWCLYNDEQSRLSKAIPEAVSVTGTTTESTRIKHIDAFKRGEVKTLISKPSILGFGLNLQIATRQVFSGLQDSYEQFYQAVKRSNRYGSTRPLNVHIPVCEVERPMVENVLRKSNQIEADTREQELLFRESQCL
tara:strand:+ start:1881 stop:3335 length:1455 start_codon:yes stop_codon:yes gene_type:complete